MDTVICFKENKRWDIFLNRIYNKEEISTKEKLDVVNATMLLNNYQKEILNLWLNGYSTTDLIDRILEKYGKFEDEKIRKLKLLSDQTREAVLKSISNAQTGHVGSSLSCLDMLVALYFSQMRYDAKNPDYKERDRFVLSKGHAAPAERPRRGFVNGGPNSLLLATFFGSVLQHLQLAPHTLAPILGNAIEHGVVVDDYTNVYALHFEVVPQADGVDFVVDSFQCDKFFVFFHAVILAFTDTISRLISLS